MLTSREYKQHPTLSACRLTPQSVSDSSLTMQTNTEALETLQLLAPGIRKVDEGNLTLLGAPILKQAGEGVFRSKLHNLQLMVDRLAQIDSHDAIFLLRHCFSIPKLMYFLRCTPGFLFREVLIEYDNQLQLGLENILNVKFEEKSWLQSTLLVSKGGLGIRLASDLSLPASSLQLMVQF